jgi:hypothetical protein
MLQLIQEIYPVLTPAGRADLKYSAVEPVGAGDGGDRMKAAEMKWVRQERRKNSRSEMFPSSNLPHGQKLLSRIFDIKASSAISSQPRFGSRDQATS